MEHPLALAVYNEGSHYQKRVANYSAMTQRHYRAYLLGLVNAQAHHERKAFGVRHKPTDIDVAVKELYDGMKTHVAECQASNVKRFCGVSHV